LSSVYPYLETGRFHPLLSLSSEKMVSDFVLECNLYRYIEGDVVAAREKATAGKTDLSRVTSRVLGPAAGCVGELARRVENAMERLGGRRSSSSTVASSSMARVGDDDGAIVAAAEAEGTAVGAAVVGSVGNPAGAAVPPEGWDREGRTAVDALERLEVVLDGLCGSVGMAVLKEVPPPAMRLVAAAGAGGGGGGDGFGVAGFGTLSSPSTQALGGGGGRRQPRSSSCSISSSSAAGGGGGGRLSTSSSLHKYSPLAAARAAAAAPPDIRLDLATNNIRLQQRESHRRRDQKEEEEEDEEGGDDVRSREAFKSSCK
jgi:hypothetical protein